MDELIPILSGCLWLPVEGREKARLKRQFTVDYWKLGQQEAIPVEAYTSIAGYIGVPRQEGLKSISNQRFDDRRSTGYQCHFPKGPELREKQIPFVEELVAAAEGEYPDFMASAATGFGKSVCALAVVKHLSTTTIVMVDQERLMTQWIDYAKEHLGLRDGDIGIVQGSRCEFHGKKLVVAMVQSLSQRDYGDEFYDYFGLAIFDECHTVGAPVFSSVLMMFAAKVRFGISATVKRGDALNKLLKWNLGEVEATSTVKHYKSCVYYVESDAVVSWYANKAKVTGRYISELVDNPRRNQLLCNAIKWLYDSGRDVLATSDRTEHISNLMAACEAMGIPADEMGIYARKKIEWRYEKDATPKSRPYGYERGVDYTPVKFSSVSVQTRKDDLQHTFNTARIIFATNQMFTKGVDLPRLTGGVDCTPSSQAVQKHGRILRMVKGKKIPVWITVRDPLSFRAEHQFALRAKDYQASNADLYYFDLQRGVQKVDIDEIVREAKHNVVRLKAQRNER